MVPASRPLLAYVILPTWPGPLPLLSGGAHTSAPHWSRSWASPNKWVAIEKQAHAMVKTKDLYSSYCPTGGCTHHLPFCLSLSVCVRACVCANESLPKCRYCNFVHFYLHRERSEELRSKVL